MEYRKVPVWKHVKASFDYKLDFALYESKEDAVERAKHYNVHGISEGRDYACYRMNSAPKQGDKMYRVGMFTEHYTAWYQSEAEAYEHLDEFLQEQADVYGRALLNVQVGEIHRTAETRS